MTADFPDLDIIKQLGDENCDVQQKHRLQIHPPRVRGIARDISLAHARQG
jgi:hypothetical protein